jgi:hypothetical protein
MRNNLKYLIAAMTLLTTIFFACKKESNPFFANGSAPVLSSTTTTIAPAPSDSNNVVASFSWTNPKYATDSSTQKFILEIDSTGRGFSKEITRTIIGTLNIGFTGRQIDSIFAAFGFTPGQAVSFDIRLTSSYGNNNEQYKSNVITVKITSYLVPITLTPSTTSPLTLLVTNATNPAMAFNWNASPYGGDTVYYALQFDTVGGNFTNPQSIQCGSSVTTSPEVNNFNLALIAAGVQGGSTKNVEFRVMSYIGSSYTKSLIASNVVTINVTTYTPVPKNLYIVGSATQGGWNNPVPIPSQEFAPLNAVSFAIEVYLTAGQSYLLLPVNGDWSHKYGCATDGTASGGGQLLTDNAVPGSNTPSPAKSGWYNIVVNFQTQTFTVTPSTTVVPSQLYIVGGATAGGWSNPVDTVFNGSQEFAQLSAVSFGIVVNLTAGQSYLFLPLNGDWGHKFGGSTDGTASGGGTLLADNSVPGSNTPSPATTGNYLIVVNFANNTYTVTPYNGVMPVPTNLYIVGAATAGGWNNPVPASQQFTQISTTEFQITLPLTAAQSYLFLPVNGSWSDKYGGTSATGGAILFDNAVPGSNTPSPAVTGSYLIDVNFATGQYTLTLQ